MSLVLRPPQSTKVDHTSSHDSDLPDRDREQQPSRDSTDTTPRRTQAPTAAAAAAPVRNIATPAASPAPRSPDKMSPPKSGGSKGANASPSGSSPGSSAAAEVSGPSTEVGKPSSSGKDGKAADKWVESVDYAYEYVPMAQRREGRKNIQYELVMRQQPVQARMCGVGEKSDRRPVDPTPIVQLKVTMTDGEDVTPMAQDAKPRPGQSADGMLFMQNPYYFLFACLVGGDDQDSELHVIDDGRTRFLTGTPVSSLYHLKDVDNKDAAFFVFPDLGVRKEGRYKLKLTLFEIVDQEVYYCTTVHTQKFAVYSAKKFPGMSKATPLSRAFAEQGLKIRVRKDPRPAQGRNKPKRKSSGQSDDEGDPYSKRSRHALTHPGYPMDTRGGYPPDPHYATYPPPPGGYYSPYGQMPPPPPPFEGYRPGSSGGHPVAPAPQTHHMSGPPPQGYPAHQAPPPPHAPHQPPPQGYYPPGYGYQRPRQSIPPAGYPESYPGYAGPPPNAPQGYDPRWEREREMRDLRDPRGPDPRDPRGPDPRELRGPDPREMRDPRELYPQELPRAPREMSHPPPFPREMSHPREMHPRELSHPRELHRELSHPRELPPHHREMSHPRDLREPSPRAMSHPRELHARELSHPRELPRDPRERELYLRGGYMPPRSAPHPHERHRPTTAPARDHREEHRSRLSSLAMRHEAPPNLGYRERDPRDPREYHREDVSRPGSGWSDVSRRSHRSAEGLGREVAASPEPMGTKPTGRMGLGHLVD